MSTNTSENELIQLIYHHLKEHGFQSAADEIHRHSPQGEGKLSASLLDIYSSWIDSKKKKKSGSGKLSKSLKKKKSKVTPKGKEKPAKKEEAQKKKAASDKKAKTNGKSPKRPAEAKELKTRAKGTAASEKENDSDSSLDVEKWKRLALEMTDADMAKIESINSLDSSLPQAPKKRVYKPRAKTPVVQNPNDVEAAKKLVTAKPRKTRKPQKNSLEENVPSPNPTLDSAEKQPAVSAGSLPDGVQTNVGIQSEENTDETISEPKKKKKKKGASDIPAEMNPTENGVGVVEKQSKKERRKKEKKNPAEVKTVEMNVSDTDPQAPTEDAISCRVGETQEEMMTEKNAQTQEIDAEKVSELVLKHKKAVKRKEEAGSSEGNPEKTDEEKKPKKRRKTMDGVENAEPGAEQAHAQHAIDCTDKPKRKKSKKDAVRDPEIIEQVAEKAIPEQVVDGADNPERNKSKKETVGDPEVTEQVAEKEIPEQVVDGADRAEKKKSKKKKKAVSDLEITEQVVEQEPVVFCGDESSTKKAKKKKKKKADEEDSQLTVEEDFSKKGANTDHNEELTERLVGANQEDALRDQINGAKILGQTTDPSTPETPGLSTAKKKRKSKAKIDEVPVLPETFINDGQKQEEKSPKKTVS